MRRFEHGGNVWQGQPSEWLDFSSNTNALGCPPAIKKALIDAMDDIGFYPDVEMEKATEGLGDLIGVPESFILPTNGGIGALELAVSTYRPGRMLALVPAFVEYERIAAQQGIPFVGISMLADRHTFKVPVARIKSELRRGDMLIVCNPVNPSGFGIDKQTLEDILAAVSHKNATLLVDEAFTWFCGGYSLKALVGQNPNLVIAGSLTKIFAMPGVRIGYLLARPEKITELRARQTPWALSAFSVRAAQAAAGMTAFIQETRIATRSAREKMENALKSLPVFVYASCANYLLTDLKPAGITAEYLAGQLRRSKILIRNCENYRGLDACHMRVAVKNEAENQRLVNEMKQAIRRAKGEKR